MEVVGEASCNDGGGRGLAIPSSALAIDTSLSLGIFYSFFFFCLAMASNYDGGRGTVAEQWWPRDGGQATVDEGQGPGDGGRATADKKTLISISK